MMQLQRHRRTGLHSQPLDLEPIPGINAVVTAPGTVHLAVQQMFPTPLRLDPRDQLLDVLDLVFRRHQHRILGLDHDVITQTHGCDQTMIGIDIAALGVLEQHVAVGDIALRVLHQCLMQRRPRTHVRPARIERHHDRILGALHDRIVDGLAPALPERLRVDAREVEIPDCGIKCCATCRGNVGRVLLEFFEVATRREQEHAAVPVAIAGVDKTLRSRRVGFFNELCNRIHGRLARATADVTIARLGTGRHHAESDQLALLSGRHRACDRRNEGARIADHMIGRQHQQQRVVASGERRERNGRRGVAADGFQHDCLRRHVDLAQLLGDREAMRLVADHDRRLKFGEPDHAQCRLLQHRARTRQRQELLGVQLARQRPEAGSGAAGEDYGDEHRRILCQIQGTAISDPAAAVAIKATIKSASGRQTTRRVTRPVALRSRRQRFRAPAVSRHALGPAAA